MSKVSIAQHEDIQSSMRGALGMLDIEHLIKDKTVALVPDDTWFSKNEVSSVIQGETLEAAISALKQWSPRKIVVSAGAAVGEINQIYELSGMRRAIELQGAELFHHNAPPFRVIQLGSDGGTEVMINERVFEYDTVVSLAQLKLQGEGNTKLSMNNAALSFPAVDYHSYFFGSFKKQQPYIQDVHRFVVDVMGFLPVHLGIIAGNPAIVAVESGGGSGRKPVHTGLVVAGTDLVAADAVGARLLGLYEDAVPHIFEAHLRGLGVGRLRDIEIVGLPLAQAVRHVSLSAYGSPLSYVHA